VFSSFVIGLKKFNEIKIAVDIYHKKTALPRLREMGMQFLREVTAVAFL
jgi:hypothetical protein